MVLWCYGLAVTYLGGNTLSIRKNKNQMLIDGFSDSVVYH